MNQSLHYLDLFDKVCSLFVLQVGGLFVQFPFRTRAHFGNFNIVQCQMGQSQIRINTFREMTFQATDFP